MDVRLVSVTPNAEKIMAFIARGSSGSNQNNPEFASLMRYCIKKAHVSVFEHAHMTVEIVTSRAIAAQIIRHKSFSFAEFSQRYAEITGYEVYEARSQDLKNRQSSHDNLMDETKNWFISAQRQVQELADRLYKEALAARVAKESARFLLPMSTQTRIYMTGNVRSFMTYLQVRCAPETQLEHREIAEAIKAVFVEQFPVVSQALEWSSPT